MRPVKKPVKKAVPAAPIKKTTLTAAEIQKMRGHKETQQKTIPAKTQTASQVQAMKAPLPIDPSTKKPGPGSARPGNPNRPTARIAQPYKPPVAKPPPRRQPQQAAVDSDSDYSDESDRPRTQQPQNVDKSATKRKVEAFDVEPTIPKTKTAAELLAEKRQVKHTIDPEEYARIKEERLRAIEEANRLAEEGKRKVVKAKIVSKKYARGEGDEEKNYNVDLVEEEIDSWEDPDPKGKPQPKIKELDSREAGKSVKSTLAIFSRKTDKVKVQGKDTEDYDVEDIITSKSSKTKTKDGVIKIPVVTIDNISKLISAKTIGKRKDILLVGLSESAKDSICDLLMDTDLGPRIFDTTLEENETVNIPKNAIAIFSEKVPILPLDEREEGSEDEDGVKARMRAKAKADALKASTKKASTKKSVIAEGDKYEEEPFNVKKDYPSVRFIFLVKVSANDRVDMKELHSNVANFMPFEKFKKRFTDLTRAECLIVDLDNRNQIYHMEF